MSLGGELMGSEFNKGEASILVCERRVLHDGDVVDAFYLRLYQMHLKLRLSPIFVYVSYEEGLVVV